MPSGDQLGVRDVMLRRVGISTCHACACSCEFTANDGEETFSRNLRIHRDRVNFMSHI